MDPVKKTPWKKDTLSMFYSSTKAVSAIVIAHLVDRYINILAISVIQHLKMYLRTYVVMCDQQRFRSAFELALSDQIFTGFIFNCQTYKVFSYEQRRFLSDCADEQADLSLYCICQKVRFLT